jgi:transposase-like protein
MPVKPKFTEDQTAEILLMLQHMPVAQVAKKYGVARSLIYKLKQKAEGNDSIKTRIVDKEQALASEFKSQYRDLLPATIATVIKSIAKRVNTLPDDADSLRACTEAFQTLADYEKAFEIADQHVERFAPATNGDTGQSSAVAGVSTADADRFIFPTFAGLS